MLGNTQEQLTMRIKELHCQIGEHEQQISKLQRELRQHEDERLRQAPRGMYSHTREDGTAISVEAAILETDGTTKYIQYQIPRFQARRGEEDAYLLWLRSPEELARLIW